MSGKVFWITKGRYDDFMVVDAVKPKDISSRYQLIKVAAIGENDFVVSKEHLKNVIEEAWKSGDFISATSLIEMIIGDAK